MMKTCDKTGQTYIDLYEVVNLDRHLSKACRRYNRFFMNIAFFSFILAFATAFMSVGR